MRVNIGTRVGRINEIEDIENENDGIVQQD